MKRLKNLKMFILAVGLTCGVQFINVSAMKSRNIGHNERYSGQIPKLSNEISKKNSELDAKFNKLKQI